MERRFLFAIFVFIVVALVLFPLSLPACTFQYSLKGPDGKAVALSPGWDAFLSAGKTYTLSAAFLPDHRNCATPVDATAFLFGGEVWKAAEDGAPEGQASVPGAKDVPAPAGVSPAKVVPTSGAGSSAAKSISPLSSRRARWPPPPCSWKGPCAGGSARSGGLLGLAQLLSPWKVRVTRGSCTSCGACLSACAGHVTHSPPF
jgi:hypothetical protein